MIDCPPASDLVITELTLGILLLVGLAAEALGRRTPLPGVTILLCLGVAIGPAGLDLLPDARATWFPIVSSFALVMIGFLIGGEFTRERLRDVGGTVVIVAIGQAAITFALIAGGLILLDFGVPMALALAGIGTATAPAATVAVVHELGASGRFSRLLIGVVAIDDVVALTAFGLALSFATGSGAGFALGEALFEIGGAIALGAAIGLPAAALSGRIRPGRPSLEEALAIVLITTASAHYLGVSEILAAVVVGGVIANLARHHERPFHEIENIEQPFLVIFFLLAGASFELEALLLSGGLGIAYIALRTTGKVLGGWLGGRRAGLPGREAAWLGVALLPQAGVALGLALVAAEQLPDGARLVSTVVFATIVFELTGPVGTRAAVRRSERGGAGHEQVLPARKRRPTWIPRRLQRPRD